MFALPFPIITRHQRYEKTASWEKYQRQWFIIRWTSFVLFFFCCCSLKIPWTRYSAVETTAAMWSPAIKQQLYIARYHAQPNRERNINCDYLPHHVYDLFSNWIESSFAIRSRTPWRSNQRESAAKNYSRNFVASRCSYREIVLLLNFLTEASSSTHHCYGDR